MKKVLIIFNLAIILLLGAYIIKYYVEKSSYENEAANLLRQFDMLYDTGSEIPLEIDTDLDTDSNSESTISNQALSGWNTNTINDKMIAMIQIPQLNINYPILNETTEENLKLGLTIFTGEDLFGNKGNTILAGHNVRESGRLLTDLHQIKENDLIEITGKSGTCYTYEVFDMYIVHPENLSPLTQKTGGEKWITIITCTNLGKDRLIVVSKLVDVKQNASQNN